jgi:hypothetical protein
MPISKGRQFVTGTIDHYLVGIAEGLRRAQEELSGLHVTRPGESPISYHIPSLEFELKLAFQASEEEGAGEPHPMLRSTLADSFAGHFTPAHDIGWKIPPIRAELLNPETTKSKDFQAEAASTIKGKFVSVPANGGAPLPVLQVIVRSTVPASEVEVVAQLGNTLGEAIDGEEVEFNVDREYSRYLNQAAVDQGVLDEEAVDLRPDTQLRRSVVVTDEAGEAASALTVTGIPGQQIAVVVFAAGVSEVVVYEIPQDG